MKIANQGQVNYEDYNCNDKLITVFSMSSESIHCQSHDNNEGDVHVVREVVNVGFSKQRTSVL